MEHPHPKINRVHPGESDLVCEAHALYIRNTVRTLTLVLIVSYPVAIKSCPVTLDLAFVMDASNQVSRRDFQLEKAFVKTVSSKFTITKHQSHIGLITYANLPSLRMRFRQYNSLFGMASCLYIEYV